MATATWSEAVLHDSDANFRIWGNNLSSRLIAISGLTQTADTGQINWTTVTRPAINTDAGYEIYYLNDSMHATAPIYIKLYYGTGTVATYPRIRIEFGTGSNGSGTLTGTGSGNIYGAQYAAGAGSATTYPNYISANEGFFALAWRVGATGQGVVLLSRSCDGDGAINGDGAYYIGYGHSSTTGSQRNCEVMRYASPASVLYTTASAASAYSMFKGPGTSAALTVMPNGDYQAWMAWGWFPDMRPLYAITGVYASQIAVGNTFTAATVGSTTHTFLVISATGYELLDSNNALAMSILWE